MKTVFVLQHLHILPSGEENTKLIGTYSSNENARAAIDRLRVQPGFCDYPHLIDPLTDDEVSGFYLDEYEVDKDHWAEGFVTVQVKNINSFIFFSAKNVVSRKRSARKVDEDDLKTTRQCDRK